MNKHPWQRAKGFTLIELFLAISLGLIIIFALVQFIGPSLTYFRTAQVRQQANMDARQCLETMRRLLGNARSSSLNVWTDPGAPPNSSIAFYSVDLIYTSTITWSNTPPNTVHHLRSPINAPANMTDTIIGTNVTGLSFTFDYRDPGVINVSLTMEVPISSQDPSKGVYTLLQPNQTIRLAVTQ